MLARQLSSSGKQLCECLCLRNVLFVRAYGIDHEVRQHEWREREKDVEQSKFGDDPEKPKKFMWFHTGAPKLTDFSIINIPKWYAYKKEQLAKLDQAFVPERHDILGADLATAHFIIHRGGRIRFKGNVHWTEKDEKNSYDLPNRYDPHYIIEAVDVNGLDMHYEGLSNLCGLMKLKWLSLKDCKNIDDWGLDKISAEFPKLEYLDISGCEKITERGLESLYKMFELKTLIVTNHHKSVAFELTCLMLEDCMPGLACEIRI